MTRNEHNIYESETMTRRARPSQTCQPHGTLYNSLYIHSRLPVFLGLLSLPTGFIVLALARDAARTVYHNCSSECELCLKFGSYGSAQDLTSVYSAGLRSSMISSLVGHQSCDVCPRQDDKSDGGGVDGMDKSGGGDYDDGYL
ncbi:hypothetical protein Tco_0435685 [Tanacetum coccineum]